jgi:hypothetical protein
MRALTVFFAVIGLAVLVTTTDANAHRIKYGTTAKLTSGGPTGAKGRISCTRKGCPPKCKAGRSVKLMRDSEAPGGKDQLFGTTKTKADGTFTVKSPLIAGNYYVLVAQYVILLNDAHRHWCATTTSLKVHF